jgi:hypothetical protein
LVAPWQQDFVAIRAREPLWCKTACKTFQIPGVNSVQ